MTGKSMKRCLFILAMLLPLALRGQEVEAGLSESRARVGEPVQLMVTVRGARGADVPETIAVKGLQITLAGRSTQFEMRNFKMSSTLTYTYLVVPETEGEFTIPPLDVKVGDKSFRTPPMKLAVSGSRGMPSQQMPQMPQVPGLPQRQPMPADEPPPSFEDGNPFFAELILSKKKAFVGEVVPVEIRFYFDSRIGGQVGERPSFGGEGFTVQKFTNPVKRDQIVNEKDYTVFSFQSAITAVKTGTLEIPEASLDARLQLPGKTPQGFDSFFNNFPQGMFADNRDVTLKTKPMQLEVLPLPKEGRPEDFSGAVGKFTMDVSVSPKKASGGEPVTLKVAVAGQGNFEGMGAPVLTGDEGWRSYPPSDQFHATDAVGFTGEKTYEFPLIARQDQTRTPGVRFSFFDPSTEKFVILTGEPQAVQAKAGTAPASVAAAAPAASPAASATPAATPDVSQMAGGSSTWTALLLRRGFLVANAALAAAWLAGVLFLMVRTFTRSQAGRELARKKHLRAALAQVAHAAPTAFYEKARDFLLLRLGAAEDELAADALIESSSLPPESKAALHRVLERHGEAKYASSTATPPPVEERQAVLAILKKL